MLSMAPSCDRGLGCSSARGLRGVGHSKVLTLTHNPNVARVEFMRRPQNGEWVAAKPATMPNGTHARVKVCAPQPRAARGRWASTRKKSSCRLSIPRARRTSCRRFYHCCSDKTRCALLVRAPRLSLGSCAVRCAALLVCSPSSVSLGSCPSGTFIRSPPRRCCGAGVRSRRSHWYRPMRVCSPSSRPSRGRSSTSRERRP